MDIQLKFGCQTKASNNFKTRICVSIFTCTNNYIKSSTNSFSSIASLCNRDGSFWMQLGEVDVSNVADNGAAKGIDNHDNKSKKFFDPLQFSLCYGRQSLSSSVYMIIYSTICSIIATTQTPILSELPLT